MENRTYICIDLKSFYASVECVERGLDPMTTNLVVADPERSEKTICLAITPTMKALGIKNRCRLFEIPKNIDYIIAPPRMQKYIDYAAEIYAIYLRFISKDDIHIYSIDEAFLDITEYLATYHMSAKELALMLMGEILREVGVRATCGIGTNLYLAKIALDITAKHAPDFIGVLDEVSFKEILWDHKPLTDFWRIGKGTATTLERYGITTMRQIAVMDEDFLYSVFGIDAELLIDHAWGREPVTIADIKAYKPKINSLSSGQVLMRDYSFEEGRLIVREMMDLLCLDLVDKGLVTDSVSIYIGYSNALHDEPVRGTAKLNNFTSADSVILPAVTAVYDRIVDRKKPVRRINISCNHVTEEDPNASVQLSLFDNIEEDASAKRNQKVQKAVLEIKKKYGKNAVLKGMNFSEAATTRERNRQIGGIKVASRPKTPMPIADRAKQFLPFAAVKGLPEALAKKEKVTIAKVEVSEELAMELDEKMQHIHVGSMVTVTYFDRDAYVHLTGTVIEIDTVFRTVQIDESIIAIDDILDLTLEE